MLVRHCLNWEHRSAGRKVDGTQATIHHTGAASKHCQLIWGYQKVLFIQKSTIPDSIKLQTNEEGGKKKKKKLIDYSIYWRGGRWLTYELKNQR